jgi:hypothetical protein
MRQANDRAKWAVTHYDVTAIHMELDGWHSSQHYGPTMYHTLIWLMDWLLGWLSSSISCIYSRREQVCKYYIIVGKKMVLDDKIDCDRKTDDIMDRVGEFNLDMGQSRLLLMHCFSLGRLELLQICLLHARRMVAFIQAWVFDSYYKASWRLLRRRCTSHGETISFLCPMAPSLCILYTLPTSLRNISHSFTPQPPF